MSKAAGLPQTSRVPGYQLGMVKGEVASCLHLNTQVGPATGLRSGVSEFIVARDNVTTPCACESAMAKRIEHTP